MHASKIWPIEKYAEGNVKKIADKSAVKFFLFGGGEKEIQFFGTTETTVPFNNCIIVAGKLKLKQELALMEKLDMMLCVDSSNMHLASLIGIPILSIWGGTHTDVGFGPFGKRTREHSSNKPRGIAVQALFRLWREKCYRGDFACLTWITPETVVEKINKQSHQFIKNRIFAPYHT